MLEYFLLFTVFHARRVKRHVESNNTHRRDSPIPPAFTNKSTSSTSGPLPFGSGSEVEARFRHHLALVSSHFALVTRVESRKYEVTWYLSETCWRYALISSDPEKLERKIQ